MPKKTHAQAPTRLDTRLTLRIDRATLARLENIKDKVGIEVAENIRRAVAEWLERNEQRLTGK